jgi:CheY-like chemotaxis protein
MADPVQMHQVIMNLGTNALHAMEKQEHGTLRISLQNKSIDPSHAATDLTLSAGEYVELKVNDDGCGIDEDAKQRIFEPYFSTRKKQGGTGLGLAVVHSIIKDFNGSISLESYPEQGTTFTVLIPAADIEQINPISEDNSNKNRTGAEQVEDEIHPRHVLVVDPDDKAAALAKNILEPRGYKITSTGSSSKALEIFTRRKNQFDVVIADYALAEMNGIELAKELRAFHPDIPILLCRDYSSGVKQHDIREAGVQMVLNKPLQGYQLSLAVDSILNT